MRRLKKAKSRGKNYEALEPVASCNQEQQKGESEGERERSGREACGESERFA
jgi:hypothetical protein